jgi:hypothetical protein
MNDDGCNHEYYIIRSLPEPLMYVCKWCGNIGRMPTCTCMLCKEEIIIDDLKSHLEICQKREKDG